MNDKKEPQESTETNPTRMKRFVHFILKPEIAIPLIVVMLLFAAPFTYRSYRINQLPDIDHPFDLEAFLNFEVPDEENAYIEYNQAFKRFVAFKGNSEKLEKALHDGWNKTPQDVKHWLNDNHEALKIWKKGTEKPDAQYELMKDVTLSSLAPYFEYRSFDRLAVLASNRQLEEENLREAWEWNRALFRFSRHLGKRGLLINRRHAIVMFGIHDFSFQKWLENPNVDASLLRQALKDLESDYHMTAPDIEVLKAEYVCHLKFHDIDYAIYFDNLPDDSLNNPDRIKKWWLYFRGEPDLSAKVMQHVYTNWFQKMEKKPFNRANTIPGKYQLYEIEPEKRTENIIDPSQIERVSKDAWIANRLMTTHPNLEEWTFWDQAKYHCLRIVIAAQIQLREKGTYPEKLEELKDILGEIPYDPFYSASRRDLQYRKEKDGFVVWSVGKDEKDELGAINEEWPDRMAGDDIGFRIQKNKPEKKRSKK